MLYTETMGVDACPPPHGGSDFGSRAGLYASPIGKLFILSIDDEGVTERNRLSPVDS